MCGSTSMSAYRPFGIPTCRGCGIQDTRHAGRPVGVPAYRHDSTPTPDRRPCTSAFRKRSEPDGRQVGVSVGRDSDQAACPSLAGWAARPASCSAYRVPGLPECRPHAPACPLSGAPGATRRGTARCAAASEAPVFGVIHKRWMGARGWPSSVRPTFRHAAMLACGGVCMPPPGARVNPRPSGGRPRLRAAELRSALPAGR